MLSVGGSWRVATLSEVCGHVRAWIHGHVISLKCIIFCHCVALVDCSIGSVVAESTSVGWKVEFVKSHFGDFFRVQSGVWKKGSEEMSRLALMRKYSRPQLGFRLYPITIMARTRNEMMNTHKCTSSSPLATRPTDRLIFGTHQDITCIRFNEVWLWQRMAWEEKVSVLHLRQAVRLSIKSRLKKGAKGNQNVCRYCGTGESSCMIEPCRVRRV